ncbi:site-specific integrase [Brevundimonas sp.]|uniref:site-specific integrase n=1 Tax=Brevundimonas sp. TaxID=1871086 RepID=UPI00391D2892
MSNMRNVPSSDELQSLIDHWLRAELSEDAYLRKAPEGEWHEGVILRRDPESLQDEVIEVLGDTELRELFALPEDERAARIGPSGYLVTDVCDLHLRQAAFRRGLEGAVERHQENDGALAERHVADVFRRAGYDTTPFSEAFEVATRLMIRAHRDLLLAVQHRDVARWRPDLDEDPAGLLLSRLAAPPAELLGAAAEPPSPASGTTLKQAVALRVAEARRLGELSEGRLIEYERAAELFCQWAGGDLDLDDVTPAVAGRFREDLIAYPTNASKRAIYKGLSVTDRIAKAKDTADTATLSAETANGKYLDPLRGIFDWAKKTGRVHSNPFTGINVSTAKSGSGDERRDFRIEELRALFSAPLFTGSASDQGFGLYQPGTERVDDWRYWLPIMALYSGARLNELCGLRLDDFEEEDGVSFFHVRPSDDRGLKTTSSKRVVPVHAELVGLGLLVEVDRLRRAGGERLFPDLTPGPRGYLSHKPSKFYGRFIERVLGKQEGVVFHSFRHTFITGLRKARVPREVRTALVGHEDGGVHEAYGSEPMDRLNEAVQAVGWPTLDLRALRLPKL